MHVNDEETPCRVCAYMEALTPADHHTIGQLCTEMARNGSALYVDRHLNLILMPFSETYWEGLKELGIEGALLADDNGPQFMLLPTTHDIAETLYQAALNISAN